MIRKSKPKKKNIELLNKFINKRKMATLTDKKLEILTTAIKDGR